MVQRGILLLAVCAAEGPCVRIYSFVSWFCFDWKSATSCRLLLLGKAQWEGEVESIL